MPKGEELSVEQQTVLRHEGCTHAIPVASGLDALDRVRQIIEGDPAAREWGL
jgi:hypothetical protein